MQQRNRWQEVCHKVAKEAYRSNKFFIFMRIKTPADTALRQHLQSDCYFRPQILVTGPLWARLAPLPVKFHSRPQSPLDLA